MNATIKEYILSAAPSGWPSVWEWQPSYMWVSGGYGYLVLPAMNYAGLQEVSFRIGNIQTNPNNIRTILYGPSATNYGNTAVEGLTTGQFDLGASSAALFTIKDGALYKDGSKLYDLEGAVMNGTLPLAFAVKGMGSVALYVSDFTVSYAAPQAGTVIEASRYNTTVSTASGMYAGGANVGNVIFYEGNQANELIFDNGYYTHTRVSEVYEYYITFAATNYSLYEQFGAVTFRLQGAKYQTKNYSVYCGETLLLSNGSKDAASVFHIKGGKLYADLAYKMDVPSDVYNGLAPLVLKIVFDPGDTNMGINISDVTTVEKVETAVSVYQDAVVRVSDKDISMNGGDRTDITYEPEASIAFSGMGISGYSEGTLILPAVRAIEGSMTFYFGISGTAGQMPAEGYVFETGGVTIYEYGPNDLGKAIKITVMADGSVLVNDESAAPAGTVSAEVIAGTAGFEMKLSTAGDITNLWPNARISQYAYYAL